MLGSAVGLLSAALAFTAPPWVHYAPRGAHQDPRLQFGLKNPFADKRDGATTLALTLAFRVSERGPRSVLGQLDAIAAEADTSTAEGISDLTRDTALALLRRETEWIACCGSAAHERNDDSALSVFDRLAIREAAKFDDRDPSSTVDAALSAAGLGGAASRETIAVACLVACLVGDRKDEVSTAFQGDAPAMRTALQEVAAAGSADDDVLAFELFWVPGGDDEVVDMDELAIDWPELMPC